MEKAEVLRNLREVPEQDRASIVAEATKEMSSSAQQVVAREGIDPGAWPQESMHRMITILGSLVAALAAGAMAVWQAIPTPKGLLLR